MKKIKETIKKIKPIHIGLFLVILMFIFAAMFMAKSAEVTTDIHSNNTLTLPFFGSINLQNTSLIISSILIGFVDGFNPCAMWVLIYLISLCATLKDKKKMFMIVGTFVITEAVMYFGILAGWLKVFEFVGFSKWIMWAVAGFALYFGGMSLYNYIKSGGQVECEVGDLNQKKKTRDKIKHIIESPITIGTIIATIILAVGVNAIEFVCSAGLPAIFTSILANADVTTFMKYIYIGLYDLFFMIDDFIIFGLALSAFNSPLLDKYSGYSKLIGGIIMLLIGIALLFFPSLLF